MSADTAEKAADPEPHAPPHPRGTIVLGTVGSVVLLLASFAAAAGSVRHPFLGGSLDWLNYGHGHMLAELVTYLGYGLLAWAWIRLGRLVLTDRVRTRSVLVAAACWTVPMLFAPALFTRDVFSYLAQGAVALQGFDPFTVPPTVLGYSSEILGNVHPFWQGTPAPYGPLFILLAKGTVWLVGSHVYAGIVVTRLIEVAGLALLVWALPGLVRHLGGKLPVAAWLLLAGPLTVVHLVGGPHNDLLMIGFLAAGTLLVLDRRHVLGIAVVTLGVAVKASAGIALPFLVWVWAARLPSTRWRNFVRATACALGVFVVVFAVVSLAAWVNLGWLTMVNASSRLVNWLSPPTALGELVHGLVGIFVDVSRDPFVTVTRILGLVVLVVLVVRQWWLARAGGPDAVRRAAIALLLVAVLSATMLPWYLTWALALGAALPWKPRWLAVAAGVSVFMVAPYSASGEQLLYEWPLMIAAIALSAWAGYALVRPAARA
ncbi:polyprenol phosphomannose-dependent alpha 1,6 mannosyltransferase MptB [Actinophytocola algeriensis]|uniref:Alpha-1,6-mannosyltransferase n=1 Tax=Actinophytocola algeriensis TaxID=1768010 RepID=A0A7W7QBV3_9PSEU|nr:polyprenol phosphomannose-dependent alpha 1,6 mannosyltransferase MptB [Actinophytocola algeriensis]MBB4910719.1 alpha-1,6-mannosyltransferase [Actinophytocola algeriensis]MBE1473712.1 alpha-1,6-mannosyltransferase [Actinophytocola algeriensis]